MIDAIGIPLLVGGIECFGASSFYDKNYSDRDLEIIGRIDALLKASFLYNVPAYFYSLSDIPAYLTKKKISAFSWGREGYQVCEIDLPKYTEIYCSPNGLKKMFPDEYEWLSENTIFTDEFGLPKCLFQSKLLMSELSQYAIPTVTANSFDSVIKNASLFAKAFLKPSNGRKALGAMKIEQRAGQLFFLTPSSSGELTTEALSQYYAINGFNPNDQMMIEPCLNILNDDGRAVDFRCLVSLNGRGEWQNVLTYARIGGNGVASNISCGGYYNAARDVLEELIPGHGVEKLAEIDEVALKAAALVQKESPNFVSWLGLDICVDRPSNQIYLIEANSKPAMKMVGKWELALMRAQYFRYILKNGISK